MPLIDTSREAQRRQGEVFRAMGPGARVAMAFDMSEMVFAIARAGIGGRHPEYGEREVRLAEFRQRLGDPLFTAAFPDAPLLAP